MVRRRLAAVTGLALVVVTAVGEGWVLISGGHAWSPTSSSAASGSPATAVPTATATVPVTKTDLATTTQISGTLGFAGDYPAVDQGPGGTITALPTPGQIVRRGQSLYEIDGSPVTLLYGARPEWRALFQGVPDGPDVRQLQENLVALGFATTSTLKVNDHFDGATAAAVSRWQHATGQAVTGRVELGAVLYEPGALRVASVAARPGQPVHAGDLVVTATSPTSVVSLPVPANQTQLVHVGDTVQVTLPSGKATPGRIASVATAATVAADSPNSSDSSTSSGSQASGRQPGVATIPATVSLTDPGATAGLDQAPVTVEVTDQSVHGVLAVPVTALVALAGGGYGVYVHDAAARRLVGVTPGLFSSTLVEVRGSTLHAGDEVEVPAG